MPDSVRAGIEAEGPVLDLIPAPEAPIDVARIFVTVHADMRRSSPAFLRLAPGGIIRASWPRGASKVPTDVDEDRIRDLILPATDLVDVKVCAVDSVWSGLKPMVRRRRQFGVRHRIVGGPAHRYCERFALSLHLSP